jgi:hypothetical protein
MQEYKIGRATVRIHGAVNQEMIKDASIKFMKKVIRKQKNEIHKNSGRMDRNRQWSEKGVRNSI